MSMHGTEAKRVLTALLTALREGASAAERSNLEAASVQKYRRERDNYYAKAESAEQMKFIFAAALIWLDNHDGVSEEKEPRTGTDEHGDPCHYESF